MKFDKKTVGLLTLVIVLLVATGLIASRLLFSQSPSDTTLSTPKTKATFQKEVNITIPTPTAAIIAQAQISPTVVPSSFPTSQPTTTQLLASPTPTRSFSPTPTETVLAYQGSVSATLALTPTSVTTSTPNQSTLPSAGSYEYPLLILLAASLIVIVSLIY